jgi:drug/metabolite transporter (DMT)-like permease
MGAFVKEIGPGVGTAETVFFRGMIGSVIGLLLHLALRRPLRTGSPRVMGLRILTGTLSLFCYYGSIVGLASSGKGELATANLLLKTAPVWVALGAGFFLGEPATGRTWIALVVGIAGATVALVGPTGPAGHGSVVLGLMSGVFAAGAYLAVRKLAAKDEPLAVVTLFSMGVAVLMAPIVAYRFVQNPVWPTPRVFALMTGVALCGTFAQWLMTHAYRHGQAAVVAVAGLAEVGFALLASRFIFLESPSAYAFAGGGLAVLAGLVATWPRRVPA